MRLGRKVAKTSLGKRVDELHRPPTWLERFRAWIEGLPRDLLYAELTILSWLSLTALIGLGPRPSIERIIAQGIIERGDLAQLEAENMIRQPDPWMSLLGVGIAVATEEGIARYFLERFGRRILRTNMEIQLVLAVSLTILFTARSEEHTSELQSRQYLVCSLLLEKKKNSQ